LAPLASWPLSGGVKDSAYERETLLESWFQGWT
jgi:hypothetical protein